MAEQGAYGYNGGILRVNLFDGTISVEEPNDKFPTSSGTLS